MIEDRSRLKNFVKRFTGTVRFRNDHFGAIMGYGDYIIGESVIFRVYYMEGLGHNMFFVGQFCDSDLEVIFSKHSWYVRDTDGVELIKEKHSISLEIALQECQEQLKNDTVCKEKASNVFRKEREQYFEIQDLKAQLQDKNIAISELKKLIEKCKGKSVDTKFDKSSVVRQPNTQRIPKPSVLGKPSPFSQTLLEETYFGKEKVKF
ncbi:hypothetical protein Tco_0448645 [Tanacetum coccineum]